MIRELPPNPSLKQLKIQAKELLKAYQNGDADALERVRLSHPKLMDLPIQEIRDAEVNLSDMQWVLAREYGFDSWTKFKRHIETIEKANTKKRPALEKDIEWYTTNCHYFSRHFKGNQLRPLRLIKEYHPRFTRATFEEIKDADFTFADSQLICAREHGFENWEDFEKHIHALANGEIVETPAEAGEAVTNKDLKKLKKLIEKNPHLIHIRGSDGHTLLNMALNKEFVEAATFLIKAGADVNIQSNDGWSPLHLIAYHKGYEQRETTKNLISLLIEAGASPYLTALGDGGTALVMALFGGRVKVAELLAQYAITPNNLRVAAGLGNLDLAKSFFDENDRLTPEAGLSRGYYKPNAGWVEWQPSNDPQEILNDAFCYACRNGRLKAMGFLLDKGADINGQAYKGTGLMQAAGSGNIETMQWLLDHGADINYKGDWGNEYELTPLHMAAWSNQLEAVKFLVEKGADVNAREKNNNGTPLGYADFAGYQDIKQYFINHTDMDVWDSVEYGKTDRVKKILESSARTHTQDEKDLLLRIAAYYGHSDIVNLLMEFGANPAAKNKEGKTALDYAREQKQTRVIELLSYN